MHQSYGDVCLQGCVMLPHVLMEAGVLRWGTGRVSVLLGSKGHDASTVSFLYRVTKQHKTSSQTSLHVSSCLARQSAECRIVNCEPTCCRSSRFQALCFHFAGAVVACSGDRMLRLCGGLWLVKGRRSALWEERLCFEGCSLECCS